MEDIDLETEQWKDRQLIPVLQCLKSEDSGNIYTNYELINRVLHQRTNETFKESRPVIAHQLREFFNKNKPDSLDIFSNFKIQTFIIGFFIINWV